MTFNGCHGNYGITVTMNDCHGNYGITVTMNGCHGNYGMIYNLITRSLKTL